MARTIRNGPSSGDTKYRCITRGARSEAATDSGKKMPAKERHAFNAMGKLGDQYLHVSMFVVEFLKTSTFILRMPVRASNLKPNFFSGRCRYFEQSPRAISSDPAF